MMFTRTSSFSSQNIFQAKLRLRRHQQRHRFALLNPDAAHCLTATPETTAALLQDILDAFPDAHRGLQSLSHLSKTKLLTQFSFARSRVLEILIMLLGAFSTDLLPGDRLDIVEKGLRHQGLTDAWLEM